MRIQLTEAECQQPGNHGNRPSLGLAIGSLLPCRVHAGRGHVRHRPPLRRSVSCLSSSRAVTTPLLACPNTDSTPPVPGHRGACTRHYALPAPGHLRESAIHKRPGEREGERERGKEGKREPVRAHLSSASSLSERP